MKKLKCWEDFKCGKKTCPVYKSKTINCWLISGTHCHDKIQGKFIEKMEMCLECKVFKANMNLSVMRQTIEVVNKQFKQFRKLVRKRDRELEDVGMELALGLSEAFEALNRIASGDPFVRISEVSKNELISKLKHVVNNCAKEIASIVDQSHKFAIGIAEHFDVLSRVSRGDLSARVSEVSQDELLKALGKVTNKMIESVSREINERKKAEQEIREREAREALILSSLPMAFYSVQFSDGSSMLWVSKQIENITGFNPDRFTEDISFWDSRIHPDDRIQKREKYNEIFEKGSIALEYRWQCADDVYRWFRDIAVLIRNENGNPKEIIGVWRDISERKETEEALRESEERLRLQINRMPIGCISWDTGFRVIQWNPASEKIFGFTEDEAMGKHPYELIVPKSSQQKVNEIWQRLLKGDSYAHSINENVTKDGRVIVCSWHNTPLKKTDGTVIGVLSMVQDITEQKRAEEDLRKYREKLEELVKERTTELEAAVKELESFSYSVSHDLRAPLRAITGFSNILLEDYSNKLDDEGKRILNVISDNTKKMGALIDDLLALSRIGRKDIEFTVVNMNKIVEDVYKEVIEPWSERDIEFSIENLPVAYGDQIMIHQVFFNLLSNAVKFTGLKNKAIIKVGAWSEEKENVYFVKDNGVGFDMQYAEKIFGPFQRLHTDKEFSGTGIGLAIVSRIIKRHKGRVWAEGKVNEGATVYFSLPKE